MVPTSDSKPVITGVSAKKPEYIKSIMINNKSNLTRMQRDDRNVHSFQKKTLILLTWEGVSVSVMNKVNFFG